VAFVLDFLTLQDKFNILTLSEKIKLIFTLRIISEKLVDDSLFYLPILKDYALYFRHYTYIVYV